MSKTTPIKHHYIPQFILRNFADENKLFNYWDNKKKELVRISPSDVFMNRYMYTSASIDKNHFVIEENLSKYEFEVAPLFKKMKSDNKITITRRELEMLRIFLTLLSFRSDKRMKQYRHTRFDNKTKEYLDMVKDDESFEQYWKNEVNELSKCRSYNDIKNNNIVDDIVKQEFMNDIEGYYMTILEARGQDFIIPDTYPVSEVFPLLDGINIHMHYIFPISPNRAILLNHIMFRKELDNNRDENLTTMVNTSKIKGNLLKQPKPRYAINALYHVENDKFDYDVVKAYEQDVCYINQLMLNEVANGFAFNNYERIEKSLSSYNLINNIKNDYKKLLLTKGSILDC